ncbi:MAG: 50S ribosome-binding GTPase [Chitinispirillales bacterium]|nr:50S ribosome-binding GTPase [Chitinispirillales bacterium]
MTTVSKSLRLQIGIFGRANTGKSSFLNKITSQNVSIVSPLSGTTRDVVEKVMEFRPVGPVVLLDTAGIDDSSQLSSDRIQKTSAVFDRADVFVVITEDGKWGKYEESLAEKAAAKLGVQIYELPA